MSKTLTIERPRTNRKARVTKKARIVKVNPLLYVIDLFCGFGGTTTGMEWAMLDKKKIAKVIACINHDKNAIASHHANWPDAIHKTEDIRTTNIDDIIDLVNEIRAENPDAIIVLWASLECTNFSKAKGGMSRNADSRTLAEHLYRYIDALNPNMIWVENVTEFKDWGPLKMKTVMHVQADGTLAESTVITYNKKKKEFLPVWIPVKEFKGTDYNIWKNHIINTYGYRYDDRALNSADYGAYTSRNRLFIQFVKPDLPLVWPQPTHTKDPEKTKKLSGRDLLKHKPVKDVLNFSNEGESIFTRKIKPVPKTLARVYAGLLKFVANGDTSFLSTYYSDNDMLRNHSLTVPVGTLTTENRHAIVNTSYMVQGNSGNPNGMVTSIEKPSRTLTCTGGNLFIVKPSFVMASNGGLPSAKVSDVEKPARTLTCTDNKSLVQPFMLKYNSTSKKGVHNPPSVDNPCPTIAKQERLGLIQARFLQSYYGNGGVHSLDDACPTLTTKDRFAQIVTEPFLIKQFSQGSQNQSINQPAMALTTVPKLNLLTQTPWILDTQFNNVGRGIDQPAPTITANRKLFYLLNPQYSSKGSSVENPSPTLIARMDKAPLYLVVTEQGQLAIEVYPDDCEIMVKIKQFMAAYGIVDIKMRMLEVDELLDIQGLGKSYKTVGTKTQAKKYIGNSVVPLVPQAMCETFAREYYNIQSAIAA